jgi:ankyrin repeat protein
MLASPMYYASLGGLKDLVQRLLDDGHSVSARGGLHKTPIEAASANGFHDIVALLLIKNEQEKTGSICGELASALTSAANNGELGAVRLLLAYDANPNGHGNTMHSNPLLNAARHGYTDIVRLLIDAGADPNLYHEKPRDTNPLEAAATRGHHECVSIMLPKAREKTALGALKVVKHSKDRKLLELFIDYVPNAVMTYAAMLGYDDIVTDLLQSGTKPETKLNFGYLQGRAGSALVAACEQGNLDLAEKFLAAGADVNAPHDASEDTFALNNAARSGNAELVSLLLEYKAEVEAMGTCGPPLQIATYSGHLDVAQILIRSGASLSNGDGSYGGPVQGAVLGGHLHILDWLYSLGADVNMLAGKTLRTGSGVRLRESPLQAAVASQQPLMVDWLLKHGADPDVTAARGYLFTPLCMAAQSGDTDILKKLLAAGADVNKLGTSSLLSEPGSALFHAVLKGHESTVKMLLATNADTNVVPSDRESYTGIKQREPANPFCCQS